MNEMLRDEVKKLWPTVRQRALNFALAPNGGEPVLVLSKKDLNLQKFASRMAKAKKQVDTAQVWFGTVSKDDDKVRFDYSPDESKGEVRPAAFRRALKVLGNDKELKLPMLVKAIIAGPGLDEGMSLESTSSRKAKVFGSTFRDVEKQLAKVNDPDRSPEDRAKALEAVRAKSAKYLRANAGERGDEAKSVELWEIFKRTTASTGEEPDPRDLPFVGAMLERQVTALAGLEDTDRYAEAVQGAVDDLEMFLETALESDNDEVIQQLMRLYREAAERRDALLYADPVDRDEANELIEGGFEELRVVLDAGDEDEIEDLIFDLEDLRDRCVRDGLFEQVESLALLLEMASKPWCFDDTGEFRRRYRINLADALADAGRHDRDTQTALLRGWRTQLDGVGEDDPGLLIEFPVISLAYGVQQLKESHPAVWDIIETALEDDGDGYGRGSVADAARKERLDRLFGDPQELRERATRRKAIDEQGQLIVDEFDWEAYDRAFDEDKVGRLEEIVRTGGSSTEVLTTMLGEEDEGIALSEEHDRGDVKKLIVDSLQDLVEGGLDTLYIEHFRRDEHQDLLDEYMETGVEPRQLTEYLDAQAHRHNPHGETGGPAHRDVDLRAILRKAWEVQESTGVAVRIVAIDSMDAKADPDGDPSLWGEQRTKRMNGLAHSIIDGDEGRTGKFLILAGGAHNHTHPGGPNGVPGMGQLCQVPVLTLDEDGGPKLELEDKEERHATPVRGGKAVLVKATMSNIAFDRGDALRHQMPFEITVEVPEDATGADYRTTGEDAMSIHGVRFEWWERIENHWDFAADDPTDVEEVRTKKERGEGGSIKAWGDLYRTKPRATTYAHWVHTLDQASRGELGAGRHTIQILDKPAVGYADAYFTKRVLRFRCLARDAYGKREIVEATQVCIVEDGAPAYACYQDTAGNRHEWSAPGYGGGDVTDEDRQVSFDLEDDMPIEKWGGVPRFLTEIAELRARPFVNKELNFIKEVKEDSNCLDGVDVLYERFIGQAYCALPPTGGGEMYVQTDADGGGLLVAKVKGERVLAMWFTDDREGPAREVRVEARPGGWRPYSRGGRSFVEMPLEHVLRMGGDR